MRIAIAGGHGRIAMKLTGLLAPAGHEVFSIVRNPAHEPEVSEAGGEPVRCDLEAEPVSAVLAALPDGVEAVVFAAGAGPGSGAERKETMDYGGAVKLLEAARSLAVSRYLMVSSMRADPDHAGDGVFDVYLRAKGRADQALAESGLDHTIVRPGSLTDDPGTGRVAVAPRLDRGEIPREDVAAVLAGCLESGAAARAAFDVTGGETPIAEALGGLASQQPGRASPG